jgi:hypothetical protein
MTVLAGAWFALRCPGGGLRSRCVCWQLCNGFFVHAFFTATSKDRYGISKDIIDDRRVARVRWIAPVIGGLVNGTKCYSIREHWLRKKPTPEKRLYVVREETYVIWLIKNPKGFYFKTAYVTGHGDIKRYLQQGARLIWER